MAQINSFLDVVTLAQAKTYMRIDDTITSVDAEITQMINSAFEYMERETNHLFGEREREYLYRIYDHNTVNVYDFPINDSVTPEADFTKQRRPLYTRYQSLKGDEKIILKVGYTDTDQVPDIFRQAVLEIVKNWYYASDENQNMVNYLSNPAMVMLAPFRRFMI